MKDTNKNLIYTNANTYRLHADNLRWTLFGGYIIIFGTVYSINEPYICLALWIFSIFYLFILSVQHWFYNLFAKYSAECEQNIIDNKNLKSLERFAKDYGSFIKLDHPAYTFALLIVSVCAAIFFARFISSLITIPLFYCLNISNICLFTGLSIFIHVILIFILSIFWNSFVYENIIKNLANLWGGSFRYGSNIRLKLNNGEFNKLDKNIKKYYEGPNDYQEYILKLSLKRNEKQEIKKYYIKNKNKSK